MGQVLYEPPDVAGWDLGQTWFSSGTMLARMNLGSTLTSNQKFNLRDAAKPYGKTPDSLLSWMLDRLPMAQLDSTMYNDLRSFLTGSGAWTGSDAQLLTKGVRAGAHHSRDAAVSVHVVVGWGPNRGRRRNG